jgi:hypothetical protein
LIVVLAVLPGIGVRSISARDVGAGMAFSRIWLFAYKMKDTPPERQPKRR